MRIRFSIREMLLATVIVALLVAWSIDHRRMQDRYGSIGFVGGAGIIEGQVVYADTGKPAEGVRVWLNGDPMGGRSGSSISTINMNYRVFAMTDAQGRYRFLNLLPINYELLAETDGWASLPKSRPMYSSDTVKYADFRLAKVGLITGRVVDEDTGQPIPAVGNQGIFVRDHELGPGFGPIGVARVDSRGHFQLRVPAGRHSLYLTNMLSDFATYRYTYPLPVVTVEAGQTTEVEFKIQRGVKQEAMRK